MNELFAQASDLVGLGSAALMAGLVVFFRIGAMVALMPILGEQVLSTRLRLVGALALTAIVAPAVAGRLPTLSADLSALPVLLIESAIGLTLGFMLRLFIMVLEIAAAEIAQAGSLSQMVGGIGPEPQPAIGQLMTFAGLALAAKMGLIAHVAALVVQSYDLMPAGRLPVVGDLSDWGLLRIASAFSFGFSLAAPFVAASVLYNLALGLMNRAMPALSVTFIGAPVLTFGALALLALALPLLMSVWQQALAGFLSAPFAVPR